MRSKKEAYTQSSARTAQENPTLMKLLSGAQWAIPGDICGWQKANIANPIVATELGIGICIQELSNFMHLDRGKQRALTGLPQRHGMIKYDEMYKKRGKTLDQYRPFHTSAERTR